MISIQDSFVGTMFLTFSDAVFAYRVPPGDVPGGQSCFISMDLLARHIPPFAATPTSLPNPLHLALLGKDDGSLHPNSLKLIIIINTVRLGGWASSIITDN